MKLALPTPRLDRPLLIWASLATLVGVLIVWDAGYARGAAGSGIAPTEVIRQMGGWVVGFLLYVGASMLPHKPRAWITWSALIGAIALLLATKFAGVEMNNAKRWLDVGIQIQTSEFVKALCVLYLGGTIANLKPESTRGTRGNWGERFDSIAARWVPIVLVLGMAYLIEEQPDLGTAAVVAGLCPALMLVGGYRARSIFGMLAVLALVATIAIVAQPYRLDRVTSHLHRWDQQHLNDEGYQTTLSETAQAEGGLIRVGITQGHTKRVLPAPTSDFVLATVGEEFGLAGTLLVLGLIGGVVYRLMWLARAATTRFGKLVPAGVAVWITLQTCANYLMANGTIMPIGIPLPFISSGGSSLMAIWLGLGLSQAAALAPRTGRQSS